MKIQVDDKILKFDVNDDDTIDTVKEKIALASKTIASHVRIRPELPPSEVKTYIARTLEHEVSALTNEQLIDSYKKIAKRYPQVTIKDISILWASQHGFPKDPNLLVSMKVLSRQSFSDVEVFKRHRKEYEVRFEALRRDLETKVADRALFEGWLREREGIISLGDFKLTDIEYELTVRVKDNIPLIALFDKLAPSKNVAFATYSDPVRGVTYYKAFAGPQAGTAIPQAWVEPNRLTVPNMILWILRTPTSRTKVATPLDYSMVVWTEDKIHLDVELTGDVTQDEIEGRLFDAFGTDIEVIDRRRIYFKGSYSIPLPEFDTIAFLDIVTNHPIISLILFLNEQGEKTVLMKSRLYVYFYPQRVKNVEKAMSVIITHEDNTLKIRLSRITDDAQVREFSKTFEKILGVYEEDRSEINDIYSAIIPNLKVEAKKTTKKTKKIGKRIDALKEFDPDLFQVPFYSRDVCQKNVQPYVVPKDKVEEFTEEHGKNKIIEFPDKIDPRWKESIHYACEPREASDKGEGVFPGLKPNRVTTAKHKDPLTAEQMKRAQKYEEEHRYLPCCYPVDQISKKSSGYNEYLRELKGIPSAKEKKKTAYTKTIEDKQVPMDREGALSDSVLYLLGKTTDKIVRYGVVDSPNSLLHCLELAFNEDYRDLSEEEREDLVRKIRKDIPNRVNIVSAKQELYDYSIEDILDFIDNVDRYFDPDYFVRLCEYLYGCNIFIFVVDSMTPKGDFSMPYHKNGYYYREVDVSLPTVVIIKLENQNVQWPYRCEIVREGRSFTLKRPASVANLAKAYEKFMSQYEIAITQSKTIFVRPLEPQKLSDLLTDAISQNISSDGKVFALNYPDKITLMTSPAAPLNIPFISRIFRTSRDKALEFAKKYTLRVTKELSDRLYVRGRSFRKAYIPIVTGGQVLSRSALEVFKRNRKIAMFLKEYALKVTSKDKKLRFIIDPKHNYDIDSLTSTFDLSNRVIFDKQGKMIVTSEDVRDKLRYFVESSVANVEGILEEYRNATIIKDYYQNVSDFIQRSNQIVSSSPGDVIYRTSMSAEVAREPTVSSVEDPEATEPYFFRYRRINDGALAIVQNVQDGNLSRVLNVAKIWNEYHINAGYNTPPLPEGTALDYDVYSTSEITERKNNLAVFRYGDGRYAAIIFLE